MTPSPEQVGPGIVNLETERNVAVMKKEIEIIVKNAINRVKTEEPFYLSGLIAEREKLSSSEIKVYFHPVITFDNILEDIEGDFDHIALGGKNFSNQYGLNLEAESGTIDWGGETGDREYRYVSFNQVNPLAEFLNSQDDAVFLDLVPEDKEKQADSIDFLRVGDICYFLFQNETMSLQVRFETARLLLKGLKNAAEMK